MPAIREKVSSTFRDKYYYGWVMVGVAAVGLFCSGPGQSYTFSVFIEPISRDLGISKASIASAYALATLVAAFLLPRAGKLLDKFGPRHVLIITACLLGIACLLFGAAANFLWLALGFALLRFMGQGVTMMCAANLVSQWFSAKRGFAMSLMALGFAASMAIHPPLGNYLIEQWGWRSAWVALGILTWLIMLPPLILFVFDKPEAIGLKVDGEVLEDTGNTATSENEDVGRAQIDGLTLPEAKKHLAFYLLCGVWFVVGGLVTVLHFFQVSILSEQGFSSQDAARLFTISAITMVITMPLVGKLFDAVRSRYVIAAALLFNAMALIGITLVSSYSGAVAYAVTFGITNAFMMTMFGYIWPRYFGRAHLGSIQGLGQMFGVVGASLAPVPVGYAIDAFGSATSVLRTLSAAEMAMAVTVVVLLKTPPGVDVPPGLE